MTTLRSLFGQASSKKTLAGLVEFSLFGGIVTAMAVGVLRLH